jgi:protein-tyrosine phosphatase
MQTKNILFVCLGNICRSPLAEGVFRGHVEDQGLHEQYVIDSAGTGGWHVGSLPDARSIEVGLKHGIDIRGQRARRVEPADIEVFHHVIAMDRSNQRDLVDMGFRNVTLLREYGIEEDELEVPDPYYGGPDGFEDVYKMVDRCCRRLLLSLERPD